ncbi:class I SAM-dependent methyltransferase [Aliivibrio logei]|uniref:SAM-dependent methyltransferase n=1 Tax=Aliivibrio logei 5S-186 TaxID=626086 RepID=A0ABX3B0R9_ALILO|nr:class I SAM-dependent methyltransferase [Aliivibrio logei]OEF23107.1 SAM-dependent methyltransferase [Aliivibrio logei 5S-186]
MKNIQFYNQHSEDLLQDYTSVTFEEVHANWKPFWPCLGDKVLDVGAGIGRDAKWFSEQKCTVIALEPAQEMRALGQRYTGNEVQWLDDSLPELSHTIGLGMRFDIILVSAVWMHIPVSSRARAFRKLSNLLAPNGRLVISLRHGNFNDGRSSYSCSTDELAQFSKDACLHTRLVTEVESDALKRGDVQWQTVVMSLPDDGSGDLNKVRHIIVNDSKSSTYKLALLRVLLRIADAHSSCVMDRTDGEVSIPLGLVALYWIKAYKRLIDVGNIQQNSNTKKGLAFISEDGWEKLKHLSADDLAIGAVFYGEEAKALQKTMQATIKAMKEGPIKFIYSGSLKDNNQEFSTVAPSKRRKVESSIVLDSAFFESFGSFVLKQNLWECFRLYYSWIEPLVVNQWISEMQRFEANRENNITLQTYHDCLVWLDQKHDTNRIRSKIKDLKAQGHLIQCVWGQTKINDEYHVDHCLPFSYWPNNDHWNLLPSSKALNLKKSDRVPSLNRLEKSKTTILDWWQMAWKNPNEQQRFFNEAALSLPNIPPQCRDFEAVFDAMGFQIKGVQSRLLVREW